jgi:hypothetical protein
VFLVGLAVDFVIQLVMGIRIIVRPDNAGAVDGVAVLVIVCFLIGIARSWELVGGPSIGLRSELTTVLRGEPAADDPSDAGPTG